jgi:hypothetical protein
MILKHYKGQLEILPCYGDIFKNVISKDETRYFLCAVYFNKEDFTFSATDGVQLFVYRANSKEQGYLNDFESGFFEVVKGSKATKLIPFEMNGVFPNISNITSSTDSYYPTDSDGNKKDNEFFIGKNSSENTVTMFHIQDAVKRPVNPDYAVKTLKYFKIEKLGAFKISTAGQAVYCNGINEPWLYMVQSMKY